MKDPPEALINFLLNQLIQMMGTVDFITLVQNTHTRLLGMMEKAKVKANMRGYS